MMSIEKKTGIENLQSHHFDNNDLITDDLILECINEAWNQILDSIKQYPKLLNFIYFPSYEIESEKRFIKPRDAADVYDDVKGTIDSMRSIASLAVNSQKFKFLPQELLSQQPYHATEVRINHKGKITFKNNGIINALEGIDAARLRICPVCEKIFWANRLDKIGCSTKCNQTLRTRKKREKEKNKFKSRVKKDGSL